MINKVSIRKEILHRRNSIGCEIRKAKDRNIKDRLLNLPEFEAARIVLLYASFRSEVDTVDLIMYCLANDKRIALPKVNKGTNELDLYEIKDISELATGHFGIPEPSIPCDISGKRKTEVQNINLIVVPGVAFDEQCNRLGYGKGFYDKLLRAKRSPAVALSYEDQIVTAIPSEAHDVRMDKIITEKRIIYCHE